MKRWLSLLLCTGLLLCTSCESSKTPGESGENSTDADRYGDNYRSDMTTPEKGHLYGMCYLAYEGIGNGIDYVKAFELMNDLGVKSIRHWMHFGYYMEDYKTFKPEAVEQMHAILAEAKKYGDIHIVYDGSSNDFKHIPTQDELDLSKDASYLHICANNTIYGTEWKYVPKTNGVPIIADMSSNILSKPVDVSKYGMIYAGAQKNMGIAGLGVAIIREDLLQDVAKTTPVLLDYKLMIKNDSMYNTPSAYAIYVLGLVLEWIDSLGGLEVMKERNEKKAKLVYDYLDQSTFYKAHSDKENRSLMNVTFTTPNKDLDAKFVKESIEAGMTNLKGHRSVGGIRASIYNAMPYEGVEKLVAFMKEFEENNR